MTQKRDDLKDRITRAQVRALLQQGMSVSKIAKWIGISYAHAKQLAAQESQP